jgi:hypothetical protein
VEYGYSALNAVVGTWLKGPVDQLSPEKVTPVSAASRRRTTKVIKPKTRKVQHKVGIEAILWRVMTAAGS